MMTGSGAGNRCRIAASWPAANPTALNLALHGATLEDIALEPAERMARVSFTPSALPPDGVPLGRLDLWLAPISALVVALRTAEGEAPAHGMQPVGIEQLGDLVRTLGHPLAGFDFVDSADPRDRCVLAAEDK